MDRLTIDELARRAGVTTRNVRAYQERGLLPPPQKVGRTGYYGEVHLARLSIIGNLLDRGYSLASIGELLGAWDSGGNLGELLGFEQALARPWIDEPPGHFSRAELEATFGSHPDTLARAVSMELVVPDGGGYRVPSVKALAAGAELLAAGMPLDAVLDEAAALRADADRIAARFVGLFLQFVWEPFVAAGMPSDQLPRITELIERLRPVATNSVVPYLALAMHRQVNAAVGEGLIRDAPGNDAAAAS
jgi:DNA-binding transcriptional MerR regulator